MEKRLYILLLAFFAASLFGFEVSFKVGGSEESMLKIGTGSSPTYSDLWDAKDVSAPPNAPGASALNYLYFRGTGDTAGESKNVIDSYEKLADDYKSSEATSQTWVLVVESVIGSAAEISWLSSGLGNGETLRMEDEAGRALVENMASTTSCSLPVGVYCIKYKKGNVGGAPATPAAQTINFVPFSGNEIVCETGFDANAYTLFNVEAAYFNEKGIRTEVPEGAAPPQLDPVANSIAFSVPVGCNDVDIYYIVKNKSDSNAGVARGVIHLKASDTPLLRLTSDRVARSAFTDETKQAYRPFTVNFRAEYPSDTDVSSPNFSVMMPPMESALYQKGVYWSVTARVNGVDAVVSEAQVAETGSMKRDRFDVSYPVTDLNSYNIELTVTPAIQARSGRLVGFINGDEGINDYVTVKLSGDSAPIIVRQDTCETEYAEDEKGEEKVQLSATFQDNPESDEPSGIAAIELKATLDGNDVPASLWHWSVTDMPSGAGELTATVSLTLDPTLLDGAGRSATGSVCITAILRDGDENEAAFDLWQFTLRDKDRAPAVTNAVSISGAIYATSSTFSALAANVGDDDGDIVKFQYDFYVNNVYSTSRILPMGEQCQLPDEIHPVSGQKISVRAYSISYPAYMGGEPGMFGSEYAEASIVVSNTAPDKTSQEKTEVAFAEYSPNASDSTLPYGSSSYTMDIAEFATFADADGDELRYSIVGNNVPVDVAELACVGGQVKFTIKEHKVLNDANATFKIRATDTGNAYSETTPIQLVVTPVNEKPSVAVADIYLSPLDFDGTAKAVAWTASKGISSDEASQTLALSSQAPALVGELADCIESLALSVENSSVVATYKLAELGMDAIGELLNKEASFSFTVSDDGGQVSNEYTVTFRILSTPWYPAFEIDCTSHGRHQVVLTRNGKTWTIDNVLGDLKPADYYNAGCDGLASGTTWSVAVHPVIGGTADTSVNCVAGGTSLTVEEYNAPAVPALAFEQPSSGQFSLTIQAPLSASYRLALYKKGYEKPVHVIENAFEPNESGLIAPVACLEDSIRNSGTYYYTLLGINPEGESETYTSDEFYTEGFSTALAWPEDGVFAPASGQVLAAANCVFSWPRPVTAVRYVLFVEDISAGTVSTVPTVANECAMQLDVPSDNQRFVWWVAAFDDEGNRLVSKAMQISVVMETELAVIDGTTVVSDGESIAFRFAIGNGDEQLPTSAEVQLAHNNGDGTFTYYKYKGNDALELHYLNETTASISLEGAIIAPGDLLSIRLCKGNVKGKYCYYNVK